MRPSLARAPRLVLAFAIAALLAFAVTLAALALRAPVWLALPLASTTLLAAPKVARRLPTALDDAAARRPSLAILTIVVAVLAVAQVARLAIFMHDAHRFQYSVLPWDTSARQHSCFSAYVIAADRERHGQGNIYERPDDVEYDRYAAWTAPFEPDGYLYPPTFLPIPLLALHATDDFFALRRAWFAFELALLVIAILVVGRVVSGTDRPLRGLPALAICAAPPVLLTLQFGNFQLAAYLLAMLAVVAIERERPIIGGATLGVLALAKVFPGVLVLPLLARRRWRALSAMMGAAVVIVALTLFMVHGQTIRNFFDHMLPRLAGGRVPSLKQEDPTRRLQLVGVNFAMLGLVLKLHTLGVPHTGPMVGDAVGWLFTLATVVLVVSAAARARGPMAVAQVSLAALVLAATRSPFLPSAYATIGALWLITLVAAEQGFRRAPGWAVLFVALSYIVPDDYPGLPPAMLRVWIGLVQQLAMFALAFYVLARHIILRPQPVVAGAPASPAVPAVSTT
jgi:alpha-1,2-mannosyltransferase